MKLLLYYGTNRNVSNVAFIKPFLLVEIKLCAFNSEACFPNPSSAWWWPQSQSERRTRKFPSSPRQQRCNHRGANPTIDSWLHRGSLDDCNV
mmetsp:Transcript_17186/g.39507  ORF Transcript_17186/g.39507 Transcript_17186/m.39507 type:complete len:92 (+) Transcript_17186:2171-2446(+)